MGEPSDPESPGTPDPAAAPGVDTAIVAGLVRARLFDAAPQRIGRFAVLERLGAGGMGVVYAAFDAELDRRVAIKLLFAGADDRGRLAREAQVMARLNHPNVAQIYEVGRHDDATYVAMEHVRGRTLRAWISQTSPPLRERLAALVQAGQGLASAHAAGVIHRDFKPDNAMMGDDGRVRVLDFGLARGLEDDELLVSGDGSGRSASATGEHDASSTAAGAGTPAYMAPEQWRGEAIDARTDVYAFCVTAWEILGGRRPFAEASIQQLRAGAERQRELAAAPSLPRWIERVLRRGLAVDPAQRPASIDAVLVELGRDPANTRRRLLVAGGCIAAIGGLLLWQRGVEMQRRRACADEAASIDDVWNEARADALATAFADTGLAYASDVFARARTRVDDFAAAWSSVRSEVCLVEPASQRDLEHAPACLDDGKTQARVLLDRFASPSPEIVQLAIAAVAALPDPRACADPRAAVGHIDRATMPADARTRLIEIDVMREVAAYDEALAAADRLVETMGSPAASAPVQLGRGRVLRELGMHAPSREAFEAAFYDGGAAGDDDTAMRAAVELVDTVGHRLAQAERGREWAKVARMYVERLGLDDDPIVAALETSLGKLLRDSGEESGALDALRRALEIRERIFGPDHPALAGAWAHVGFALAERGDIDEGITAIRRALAIAEAAFGPDHPEVAKILDILGLWQLQRGEYDDANTSLSRALASKEAALGEEHESVGETLITLASLDLLLDRNDAALAHDRRALEIAEASFPPDHPRIAGAITSLAHVYEVTGDIDSARQHYERGLAMRERAVGRDDGSLVPMLANLGFLLLNIDETDRAAELLARADGILAARFGADSSDRAIVLGALASAETTRKRPEEAIVLLEEALGIAQRAGLADAQRADLEFQLGRALLNTDRDHARALALARTAYASWTAMGAPKADYARTAEALIGALEKQQAGHASER